MWAPDAFVRAVSACFASDFGSEPDPTGWLQGASMPARALLLGAERASAATVRLTDKFIVVNSRETFTQTSPNTVRMHPPTPKDVDFAVLKSPHAFAGESYERAVSNGRTDSVAHSYLS